MRELKFRCWDSVLKYWLNEDDMPICGEGKSEVWEFGGAETRVRFCQYTGLKDKNGVEIYEGDIVEGFWYEYPKPEVMKIEWSNHFFGFTVGGYPMGMHGLHDMKIIGNIYEDQ